MVVVHAPDDDTWIALVHEELDVASLYAWSVQPSCGAVVLFSGTVRDHAEGRGGVTHLDYEAYERHVEPHLTAIADEMRVRWPSVGRIALVHRVGRLLLGESSVVVAVSAPHRGEAFESARYGIDTLKAVAPIWKKESWEDGEGWGLGTHDVRPVSDS